MGWFRFLRRAHWDRERTAELESYLQIETDDNIARGMSPEQARRAAHLKLGNTVRIREEIHHMNTVSLLDSLGRDVRYAVRSMRRHPTFALAVVLTLALGLGANTAIFAVVDGVLIKPLPYPRAGELVSLNHTAPGIKVDQFQMSPTQYFTYKEENRVFQHLGVWGAGGTTITGIGDPEQARMLAITPDVLQVLGVQPMLGRNFTEAEATTTDPGMQVGAGAAIVTYGYWQRRFGGDPSVIGRQIISDSRPAIIVGVMPESFRFLDIKPQPEVILPIRINRSSLSITGFGMTGLARLKPGVTIADANADIARMLPIWLNSWPIPPGTVGREAIANWHLTPVLQPLKDAVVGSVGDMLWVLMGTIGVVLLIACANVANLMLVRSDSRRQEFAVRTALGAARGQLVRGVLVEGLVLALVGGALGVALAQGALKVLIAMAPATLPRVADISLDPRVVLFAVVLSCVSSLLFCAIPAFRHGRRRALSIVSASRGASASRERQRTRSALVVVQVALALVLLVSSGLMIRTFQALQNVEPGFADPATIQTARVWIPPQQVREDERYTRMQQEILDKIAALPGVQAAGFASSVPMEPNRVSLSAIYVDGQTYDAGVTPPGRRLKFVSPGYFGAVGTRVIAGRDITWNDLYRRMTVAIVSENFAREVWGSAAAALGQRVREPAPATAAPPVWREIIGVVQDVHEDALHQPSPAMVYFPVLMDNFGGQSTTGTRAINLVIRSDQAGTEALLNGVRNAVWSVNSNMPVFLIFTMKDLYDAAMARTSFAMVTLAISGAMALGLGLIGIYGVISYVVSRRAREIGLRLALGAEPAALKRMFVKYGLVLTGIGIAIGLVGAIGLTRLMSSLLFGTGPLDPATYVVVLFVLTIAAVLASYLPARRAAMVNPMTTLAEE
jgi:predicted permease